MVTFISPVRSRSVRSLFRGLPLVLAVAALMGLPSRDAAAQVCARVSIEIVQEVTLERQAFDARMRITNGLATLAIEDVAVDVLFQDAAGDPVHASSDPNDLTAKFFVTLDTLDGIAAVDGTGSIGAESTGEIHWLIIPAPGAATPGAESTLYMVGATLSYSIGGEVQTVEVSPDSIYVRPMPELHLDYFLPEQVYGDNPYTLEEEAPIPFTLGVRVSNKGHGPANTLAIESGQPKIVENELGLLIGFTIIGSEVAGQPTAPTLKVDFGTVEAGAASAARWLMTTTLQGKFIEFTATFTHADALGGQLTSLLEQVLTHTLVADVLVDLPGRDTVRDFLALDAGALSVYESEGGESAVFDGSSSSAIAPAGGADWTVTVPATAGLSYVRVPDPLNGTKAVIAAVRADGRVLPATNAWTSKDWIKATQSWKHWVSVFDTGNPLGLSYTLTMGAKVDGNQAPVLGPLPARKVRVSETLSYLVVATDPDGTIPALAATPPLPVGAAFANGGDGTGLLTWTPGEHQVGAYVIYIEASDPALKTSGGVSIEVVPADTPNDPPSAAWAEIVTQVDAPSAPVVPTVVDPDVDDVHTFAIADAPGHGTAQVTGAGIVYVPAPGYVGPDAFTFTATDSFGQAVTGTGSVLVTGLDNLVARSLTIEWDAEGAPIAAVVSVEDDGTAGTGAPVRLLARAVTCGGSLVVGQLDVTLEPGISNHTIPLDFSDPSLTDAALALEVLIDSAKALPEPDEQDNRITRGLVRGAVPAAALSIGASGAELRAACAGATLVVSGRSTYALFDGGVCRDVPVSGVEATWTLTDAATGEAAATGSGRVDANGAWGLDVAIPDTALGLWDLAVTVFDGARSDTVAHRVTAVSCPAGDPAPMVPAPAFAGPSGSPAILVFEDGAAEASWIVHPGTPVPTSGEGGSGASGGTSGTGASDLLVLGGPTLGEPGSGGQSGDPLDAWVVPSSLAASPEVPEVGEPVVLRGVVKANDSVYGLPVIWRITGPGNETIELAPPTWFYLNGALHVRASWVPSAPGAYTVVLSVGPGHTDADPGNDGAALAVDVLPAGPALPGLALWLDATMGVDAADGVAQWGDQSGAGLHAAQADPAKRPSLVTDPTFGAPFVVFDGQDDALALPDGLAGSGAGFTILAVARPDAVASGGLLELANPGGADRVSLGGGGADALRYRAGARTAMGPHGLPLLAPHVVSVVHRTDHTADLQTDGLPVGEGALRAPAAVTRTLNRIGAGADGAFRGGIGAVLVYERALSVAELAQVEAWLADRFGLYHPDARWITDGGYTPGHVALVHANRWSRPETDSWLAWTAAHPGVPVPGVGLRLWLHAGSGTVADGGHVSAWLDDGADPWADDATQTVASAQPRFVVDGDATLLRFDGQDDHLKLPAGLPRLDAGVTVLVVARVGSEGRWASFLDLAGSTSAGRVSLGRQGTTAEAAFTVGATALAGDAGLAQDGLRLLGAVREASGAATLLRGGHTVATGTLPAPAVVPRDQSRIAGGGLAAIPPLQGDVAEILVWDRALSELERHGVEVWLADKHGLYHPDAAWLADAALPSSAVEAAHTWGLSKSETEALATFTAAHPETALPAAGLTLWLDASTGLSLAADGSHVTGWQDLSPAAHDAAQDDATKRPVLVADALSGKAALAFDGVDDRLSLPTGFGDFSNGFSMFAVARPVRAQHGHSLVSLRAEAGSSLVAVGPGGGGLDLSYRTGTASVQGQGGLLPGGFRLASVVHSQDGSVLLFSGGEPTGSAALALPEAVIRTDNAIGGGLAPFEGQIAAVVVFSRALLPVERAAVEAELADAYGLYHPDADWISGSGYAPETELLIHQERWSRADADAFAALVPAADEAGVPGVGLSMWLRADSGIATDDAGGVELWADRAPTAAPADASQAAPTARPAVIAAVPAIDGRSAVRFEGDDALDLAPGLADLRDGVTVFAVARAEAAGRWSRIVELSGGGAAGAVVLSRRSDTADLRLRVGAAAVDAPDALEPGVFRLMAAVVANDGAAQVRTPGVAAVTGTLAAPGLVWRDASRLGAGQISGFLTGEIAEVLVYDRALAEGDITAVEVYLADRYGLYHPDAAWISTSGFDAATLDLIHANQWSKAEALAAEK